MSEHGEVSPQHGEESLPDYTESLKVAFESIKQLTTLNAGSIVVIGTFLKDIFPSEKGVLAVGAGIKLLIALAFISFGVSLVLSSYAMLDYSNRLRILEIARTPEGRQRLREEGGNVVILTSILGFYFEPSFKGLLRELVRTLPFPSFTVGLLLFGLAVVLNLYQ